MSHPDTGDETPESRLQRFVRDEYGPVVAGLALISGSRAAAEDAVQEALARALLRGTEDLQSVGAWVVRVALNLVRNDFRRWRAELRVRRAAVGGEATTHPQDRVDTAVDIARALRRLSRRQREVLVLRYYLDMSVPEMADALGIRQGTIKALLHRARGAMAASLPIGDEEVDRGVDQRPHRPRAQAGS
jgi:RNA polymerase sigma factor (sigma-70 family)